MLNWLSFLSKILVEEHLVNIVFKTLVSLVHKRYVVL